MRKAINEIRKGDSHEFVRDKAKDFCRRKYI